MDTNLIDKKIFVRLKSGRQYSGKVIEINDVGNGLNFVVIIDRENKRVMFAESEIEVLEEENE